MTTGGRAKQESHIGSTVRKLWGLCSILRDEGVTYHEYLTELTYLLFLKLASELGLEEQIPLDYRWNSLRDRPEEGALTFYRELLVALGESSDPHIAGIFSESRTRFRTDEAFMRLVVALDSMAWRPSGNGQVGDIYEGLIAKNAQEARYGAGQYFTPRPLVETIVSVLQPSRSDTVYDPAAGTGGFLVAAGAAARRGGEGETPALFGIEISHDVHRLGLTNLLLHDLPANYVVGDALSGAFPPSSCSLCMTNPPFGVKGSVSRDAARALDYPTSNKQLAFVQHVYSKLNQSGRAAIIVPDNVLFEGGIAAAVRRRLMDNFNLHTILRLPPNIFYATGVRTSVLFFSAETPGTPRVWFYDLRADSSLSADALARFQRAFGDDPHGQGQRRQSASFRYVSRPDIAQHDDRLDFADFPRSSATTGDVQPSPMVQLEVLERELAAAHDALGALADLLKHSPQTTPPSET